MQVVGLTTALGTIQGTDTGTFAIGLVLSLVVSVYTPMLGTLFAQLGLTECFNIGEMAMQFERECAESKRWRRLTTLASPATGSLHARGMWLSCR